MGNKIRNIDKCGGRYRNRFTVNGTRFTIYGKTITEVREKEFEKRMEIAEGTFKGNKSVSVEQYLDRWIQSRERVIKSQTLRVYKKLIKRLCGQIIDKSGTRFGDIKLMQLEAQHVREVQNSLLEEVSTRTANDILSLLKKALTAAVNERTLSYNPAAAVDRVKRTEVQARDTIHRALTREEVSAFLSAAENGIEEKKLNRSWYYNFYVFLLYTGLRVGEAAALSLMDIKDGKISVHKTVIRSEIGYEIEEGTKTSAGTRTVPLNPAAAAALERQKQFNAMIDGITSISTPVFRTTTGSFIRSNRVNEDIKRICEAVGVQRFSCHAFRATFTSRCVQGGVKTKELMEILGHSDVNMTLGLYAHSEDGEKQRQLLAVNFE